MRSTTEKLFSRDQTMKIRTSSHFYYPWRPAILTVSEMSSPLSRPELLDAMLLAILYHRQEPAIIASNYTETINESKIFTWTIWNFSTTPFFCCTTQTELLIAIRETFSSSYYSSRPAASLAAAAPRTPFAPIVRLSRRGWKYLNNINIHEIKYFV